MKYVALLSGGKDSCYNLLHCHKNGHELVAAASLGPEPGRDEIDSYMYQTVGQDAIEYVANALDVPLYRRVISGSAVDMGAEYGSRNVARNGALEGDETEDLHALLSTVKENHPDLQGVSVGAILSNYQRVRVEHVCRRLSLTPLSYLWQRDQSELLSEMVDAGLEAILIKVAGIGLTTKHLGKTLAQMEPTLSKLNTLYGSHVCGEGGEYETLTLDSPLFKSKINLVETETVIHSDNDFATVAYLRIKSASLERKEPSLIDPSIPLLLDDTYSEVRDAAEGSATSQQLGTSAPQYDTEESIHSFPCTAHKVGSWITVTSVKSTTILQDKSLSVEDEVNECFQILQDQLKKQSLDLSHCANINIFISSLDLFVRVNAVYQTFFGSSPPARACVAVDFAPSPFRVILDCIAYAEEKPSDRQALHVQGLSYWAPANIGPYSQAVTVKDSRMFISGQIGLIPSTLTLPTPRSLALETALACQHASRIVSALKNNTGGGWQGHTQLALYWMKNFADLYIVRNAVKDLDASAPTLFLGVPELPKDALVEKQVILHTGRFSLVNEDGDTEVQDLEPIISSGHLPNASWKLSVFRGTESPCTAICVRGDLDDASQAALRRVIGDVLDRTLSIRLFYRPSKETPQISPSLLNGHEAITPVPCRFVASYDRDDWDYALCLTGV